MDRIYESINLIKDKISLWIDKISLTLPNLLLVIIFLFIGIKMISYLRKLTNRLTARSIQNPGLQNLVNNMIAVGMYLILTVILLAILGLDGTVKTLLASAGVVGLALGLALQEPLMNLFSGVIMSVKYVFDIGDFVQTNGFIGSVQEITLKHTRIRQLSGEEVNIPNKMVLQNPVTNYSTNGLRRIDLSCGISYGEDLRKVKSIASQAVSHLAVTEDMVERPVEFIYTGFGASSIDFLLRIWTDPVNVWQFLDKKSEAIMVLKEAFDEADIMIPFPIRTLDFGIKGGRTLEEVLPKIEE